MDGCRIQLPSQNYKSVAHITHAKKSVKFEDSAILLRHCMVPRYAVWTEQLLQVTCRVRAQAVTELVDDEKNGWTFEPERPEEIYSAIDRAMNTSCEQLDAMRAHARSTALALTPEDAARFIDDAIAATLKAG